MKLYEESNISKYVSKLKKIRILHGMTQQSLAELSGIGLKSLSAYEQDPRKLLSANCATVYKIADALGVEIEDILNLEQLES